MEIGINCTVNGHVGSNWSDGHVLKLYYVMVAQLGKLTKKC